MGCVLSSWREGPGSVARALLAVISERKLNFQPRQIIVSPKAAFFQEMGDLRQRLFLHPECGLSQHGCVNNFCYKLVFSLTVHNMCATVPAWTQTNFLHSVLGLGINTCSLRLTPHLTVILSILGLHHKLNSFKSLYQCPQSITVTIQYYTNSLISNFYFLLLFDFLVHLLHHPAVLGISYLSETLLDTHVFTLVRRTSPTVTAFYVHLYLCTQLHFTQETNLCTALVTLTKSTCDCFTTGHSCCTTGHYCQLIWPVVSQSSGVSLSLHTPVLVTLTMALSSQQFTCTQQPELHTGALEEFVAFAATSLFVAGDVAPWWTGTSMLSLTQGRNLASFY